MKISHFFIERPIFAAVVSIVIVLLGAIAYPLLPIAQYPEIVPPTVTVTAQYPGASAEIVANQVAEPIEEQINGVEDMLYMSSNSTGDGRMTITITFKLGTDLDKAQVLVQNRVAVAQPRLPAEVQSTGVVVRKSSPDLLLAIHLTSPDKSLDRDYIGNYFTLNIRDQLLRLKGVGDLLIRGPRDFSIRIWIDPNKAAERNLDAEDITNALKAANVQVAAGTVNQDPTEGGGGAYQLNIQTKGRLTTPAEFGDVVIKRDPDGRVTRVSDIGRVELGAQDYTTEAHLNEDDAILAAVLQLPGTNALATSDEIQAKMKELSKSFPPGLTYHIVYNPTQYVAQSLAEVKKTLLEALILVVIVVMVFLQSWRAAVVPVLAIPISLVGTFAMMLAAGFSLNNLSMFGLVLAIGIVVDDAIVVIENVERRIREGDDPRTAAHRSMDEVGGALIGIALVLCSVFIPAGLISGITGQFYRQFALTIATATLISLLISLTLSPALAALLMKPHEDHQEEKLPAWRRPLHKAAEKFNAGFDWLSDHYGHLTAKLVRMLLVMLLIYGGLILIAGWRLVETPTGFIPDQDQGSLIVSARLPEGTSLRRTDEVAKTLTKAIEGVSGVFAVSVTTGVDAVSNTAASNAMQLYVVLDDYGKRHKAHQTLAAMMGAIEKATAPYVDADIKVIPPPAVRGIGTAGGFKLIVEDHNKAGVTALDQVSQQLVAAANAGAGVKGNNPLTRVFTSFNTNTPRLQADIDREKAEIMGVTDTQIFSAMQTYLASSYVNDFNYLGRTYQVLAQADWPYRATDTDIDQLKIRTSSGGMAPLGSFITVHRATGPYRVLRYNMATASDIQGAAAPGRSTGEALAAMQQVADHTLPSGFTTEWTELAYQQETAGNTGYIVFAMAVVFAFLVLAALYESVTMPLAVMLIVPMCLFAAILGVNLMKLDNNILTQVGLIVLIGLAAKNAILIVEFAKQDEDGGQEPHEAAVNAARTRLRPILMTSFAFILGVVPLAFATGAGAEMRRALGTAVFFGMIGVTAFGLLFTPVFYVLMRKLSAKLPQPEEAPEHKADDRSNESGKDAPHGAEPQRQ